MKESKNIFTSKIVATALVAALGFSACSLENKEEKPAGAQQQAPAIPVNVFTVEDKKSVTSKSYPTIIKAYEEVEVMARVSGILEEKFFTEGDFVKKGSPLYKIEDDNYLASLNQAKANYNKADKDYKRAVSLFKSKSISNQSYDEYKFMYEDAKAKLDQAQISYNYTKIDAPIDGIVGIKQQDTGNLVGTNTSNSLLVSMTNDNFIFAEFSLSRDDVVNYIDQIKKGAVEIGLTTKGQTYKGELDFVSAKLDSNTDTLLLRAKFDNSQKQFLAGEFSEVALTNISLGDVFVIPELAILKLPQGTFVYVTDETSTAKLKPVEVGPLVKEGIVIKNGLKANDKIVISNLAKVRPDSKVMILSKEK